MQYATTPYATKQNKPTQRQTILQIQQHTIQHTPKQRTIENTIQYNTIQTTITQNAINELQDKTRQDNPMERNPMQ